MSGLPATTAGTTAAVTSLQARYPNVMHLYSRFIPNFLQFDRVVTPLWYILGLFGNTLSAYVWLHPEVRRNNSSAVYLAALSIWDLVFLVLHTFQELKEAWNIHIENFVMCNILPIVLLTAQYLSPILVLGFTVERWISICFPFKRESLCSPRRACFVIGAMTVGVVLWNLWQLSLKDFDKGVCAEVNTEGSWFWSIYTLSTEVLISGLVPVTALVFNLLVIHEMYKIAINRGTATRRDGVGDRGASTRRGNSGGGGGGGGACDEEASVERRFMSTTVMLLCVSFFVILTSLPAGLVYGLQQFTYFGPQNLTDAEVLLDPTWQRHFAMARVKKVIDEISISHYSLNFIIYLATGVQYRRHVRLLFSRTRQSVAGGCGGCSSARAGSSSSGGGGGAGKELRRRRTEDYYLNNSRTARSTRGAAAAACRITASAAATSATAATVATTDDEDDGDWRAGQSGKRRPSPDSGVENGEGTRVEKPLLATYI